VVAKILDFGIAKMTGGDEPSNLTRTGAIFGTPLYMSPEQAKGKPADARADVYALGVILYELLTGSVPFGGESSVEILSQHIGAAPVRPTEVAPDRAIAPALETLVLRALEKEPDARFASMHDFVRELEAAAATLPKPDLAALVTTPPAPPTGWNQQLKTNPTPKPGASTGRPAARTPTGPTARPSQTAPAATPRGAAPSHAALSSPPPTDTQAALGPPRQTGARNAVIALLALLLVGGGAWFALHGTKTEAPANPAPGNPSTSHLAPSNPAPQPSPAVPAPSLPAPSPAPKPTIEVILDSNPTGAKILRDGVVSAETPEALKLTGTASVVLHKDGYADKTVTIDPATTHKLVVKLERAHVAAAPTPPKKAAKDAPATVAKAPAPTKPSGDTMDPYANGKTPPKSSPPPAKPTPPPVAAPPKSHDAISARVEKQGASNVPGGHRLGAIYAGAAAEEGGRSDWFVELEGGHCFTFVGEGGDSVKKLYLYLWGPRGRRLTQTREDTPHAKMVYCTAFPGSYHFQAKVDDGNGEYRVGIYTR
jgi:serine/threonine-protein kinase